MLTLPNTCFPPRGRNCRCERSTLPGKGKPAPSFDGTCHEFTCFAPPALMNRWMKGSPVHQKKQRKPCGTGPASPVTPRGRPALRCRSDGLLVKPLPTLPTRPPARGGGQRPAWLPLPRWQQQSDQIAPPVKKSKPDRPQAFRANTGCRGPWEGCKPASAALRQLFTRARDGGCWGLTCQMALGRGPHTTQHPRRGRSSHLCQQVVRQRLGFFKPLQNLVKILSFLGRKREQEPAPPGGEHGDTHRGGTAPLLAAPSTGSRTGSHRGLLLVA